MTTSRRIVLDTNLFISAMLFKNSPPGQVVELVLAADVLLQSVATSVELKEVTERKKFDRYLDLEARQEFAVRVIKLSELIDIEETIAACRDPKDDKFLELAANGKADYLITGDDDLLILNPFRGIRILTAREFLDLPSENED